MEKKHEVGDATNNNFDHVGTLKYINLLLYKDIHLQRVKYLINEQSMNINVFLLFLSFVFLQIEREREREREREGVYKIGYKEKQSQGYLSNFLWWSSCGESFLFYGLIDFMLFLTLVWRKWLLQSEIFLCLLLPRVLALAPSATSPVQQLTSLTIYFHRREGVPTSVLGSQPIIWLLSPSFPCQATRVRSPSINICGSPLCDLHSFLTVTL